MSLEIQEWSHKSRPRINNLYLLTRPMAFLKLESVGHVKHFTLREQGFLTFVAPVILTLTR